MRVDCARNFEIYGLVQGFNGCLANRFYGFKMCHQFVASFWTNPIDLV